MSNDTSFRDSESPRSTDPARFHEPAPAAAPSSMGERLGAGLGLLVLVVAVPVLLVLVGGSRPLPTKLPDKETLTQPLSFETLLTVLLAVVWLAWFFFLVCVVVEIVAARRGGLARPVPLGGPVQKFARVLVGALLLAEIMTGPAASALTPEAVPQGPAAATSSVQQTPTQAQVQGQDDGSQATQVASETSADGLVHQREVTKQEHLAGHKVYTVAAPVNGYHDNLWDIATKHLGDGRRYKEIYELNKGLLQPDGRKLQLARLIQPGWNLVMPDDASGVRRLQSPPTTPATAPVQDGGSSSSIAGAGTPGGSDVASTPDDGGIQLPGGLMGTGLVAATALAALAFERRRRIGTAARAAAEVEAELRGFATPSRAEFLDRALRDLASACREASAPLPSVYAVQLDDESVTLQLAPPATASVGSWTASEDGSTWTREFFESAGASSGQVAPFPGLVSLGVDPAGKDVLVDLEAAGGVVAIDGDPMVSGEVAAAIALQCGTAAWAETMSVTASGLPAGLEGIGEERIRVVTDLTGTIEDLEQNLDAVRTDVLTGRVTRRGAVRSRLLVSGGRLDEGTTDRLVSLTGPDRQALAVVLAGAHPAARWTLRVDQDGNLTLNELGISVVANRIGAQQVEGIAALFTAAREPDRPDDGGRIGIPVPVKMVDDSTWSTAPRRVGVLGQVAVTGVGEVEAARAEQVTELVVYLALHPEGVHPKVLAGALWPRGVTPDVSDAAVERAREWLGQDVNGNTYLREDSEGRLSLSEGVVCDWDAARSLLIRSRRATTRNEEAELLRRGLQLVRGESFGGIPDGRYAWVAHDDLQRIVRRVFVDAAHRLVMVMTDDDDPSGGASASLAGLRVDPANQLLWRDLLRMRHSERGVAGVQQTLDSMGEPLRGIPLEAETEALVEEYLPDLGGGLTAG